MIIWSTNSQGLFPRAGVLLALDGNLSNEGIGRFRLLNPDMESADTAGQNMIMGGFVLLRAQNLKTVTIANTPEGWLPSENQYRILTQKLGHRRLDPHRAPDHYYTHENLITDNAFVAHRTPDVVRRFLERDAAQTTPQEEDPDVARSGSFIGRTLTMSTARAPTAEDFEHMRAAFDTVSVTRPVRASMGFAPQLFGRDNSSLSYVRNTTQEIASGQIRAIEGLGFKACVAGGAARDWDMNRTPRDIDIFFIHPPELTHEQILEKLNSVGIGAKPINGNYVKGESSTTPLSRVDSPADITCAFEHTLNGTVVQYLGITCSFVDKLAKFPYTHTAIMWHPRRGFKASSLYNVHKAWKIVVHQREGTPQYEEKVRQLVVENNWRVAASREEAFDMMVAEFREESP